MERHGWIYLRVVEGKGYCIGKTEDITRRNAEYTKENPFVETVCTFAVNDMDRVERILISRTAHLRLLPNSREWLRHTDEVVAIVERVRKRYALMTYAEWRQIVQERKARRLEQAKIDQEPAPVPQPPKAIPEPRPPTRPLHPNAVCPKCGFADAVHWLANEITCNRCKIVFPTH